MLFFCVPRDRRSAQGDKIIGDRTSSDGTTGPVGITISHQFKDSISTKKNPLPKIAFREDNNANGSIPMFLMRRLHELGQCINCISKVRPSNVQIYDFANQEMISIRLCKEVPSCLCQLMIRHKKSGDLF